MHANFFEKLFIYLDWTGKLSKLIDMILRGHEKRPAGYHTP
jgi:hypothetical protein